MTAPFRLALDGGPPCLAGVVPAPWPGTATGDARLGIDSLVDHLPGQGPTQTVRRLERRWAAATGRSDVVACRSASAAARLAAAALDLGPGDEVICPVDAVAMAAMITTVSGSQPVFVDLDPKSLHLDPDAVDSAVTERSRAVLVADRYGGTADHGALQTVARRHDLELLVDGSQSVGASYGHRPVGSFGSAAFCGLSEVFAGPVVGGFFATDDVALAANARRILLVNDDFGLEQPAADGGGWGWSYRIAEIDAGVTDNHVARLEYEVAVRAANSRYLSRRLHEIPGIWMPQAVPGSSPVLSCLAVLVQPDELGLPETAATALRDTLVDCMTAEGLFLYQARPQPMVSNPSGGTTGAGRAPSPRRAEFPVADAMWASGLVLGRRQGMFNPPRSLPDMDRIADCFVKILVDNADRLCQLTVDRSRVSP